MIDIQTEISDVEFNSGYWVHVVNAKRLRAWYGAKIVSHPLFAREVRR